MGTLLVVFELPSSICVCFILPPSPHNIIIKVTIKSFHHISYICLCHMGHIQEWTNVAISFLQNFDALSVIGAPKVIAKIGSDSHPPFWHSLKCINVSRNNWWQSTYLNNIFWENFNLLRQDPKKCMFNRNFVSIHGNVCYWKLGMTLDSICNCCNVYDK